MSYGPNCPSCEANAEWTEGEINEPIFGPKTYCCSYCYHFYVLTIEEIEWYQAKAAETYGGATEFTPETEADWLKARELYEKGEPLEPEPPEEPNQ